MNTRLKCVRRATGLLCACLLSIFCRSIFAATEVDPAKLPPPATNQIDFAHDIKPVLETSCLRCHGPEKPKAGFRLDNRNSALKGGENGVDILPGNSAKSPLVHFVALLVPDMEMPPTGKGKQLTAGQIALLRAWIDQGATWDTTSPTNDSALTFSPIFGGTSVSGDNHKFRELHWQKEGLNGGFEQFELFHQGRSDTKFSITGHALQDDYKIELSLDRSELGFVRSGWEQYRKYFDDTGGYRLAPSTPTAPSLGQDLHLDLGKAWIDFGLTLPHWPQMVLGYEYDYKKGNESTTSWGAAGSPADARNLAPNRKFLDEGTHIIKFDLDAEVREITIEERFRGEYYKLDTASTNLAARNPVANNTAEGNKYFQAVNTVRVERQFTSWLDGSAGYLYSKLDANSTLTDAVTFGNALQFLSQANEITLERESHVVNLNALVGPFDGLTLSTGTQGEWTRQHGFGRGNLNEFTYTLTPPLTLPVTPTTSVSEYDKTAYSETAALRYNKIPFTVLFAEARLQQQTIGQYDDDFQATGNFMENPSFSSDLTDLRAGFNTSPWRVISLSAHYRRYEDDSHYKINNPPQPPNGYPGFLRSRDILTDEVETKLVLRPCACFKTTLSYQYLTTKYHEDSNPARTTIPLATVSPGGSLLAGEYDSRIYSINATLRPIPRIYLSGTFSYQPTTTFTASQNSPTIAPYDGKIYTVIANGTFVWTQTTDLFANYLFSEADYAQNNTAGGLPVGIEYQWHSVQGGLNHRFGKRLSGKIQYAFDNYNEPTSGGANNYHSHAIFASLTCRLP